jgi:17beta-estradiol 17-dehydrogenase / very-long-chain 3-oxoacyl-CoA reductase
MDFNVLLAKVPNSLLVGFAAIGLLAVSSKVINYTRLLLSLFVLSGKNVRPQHPTISQNY